MFNIISKKLILAATISVAVVITFGVIVFIILSQGHEGQGKGITGAVVTNGVPCANIGKQILDKGGSAVDAAIAAAFCEGVAMAQSCGLGGGFLMVLYDTKSRQAHALNARETAPSAATLDMFHGNKTLSSTGILSVAVPGELRGYWEAYKRFGGRVPWKDLVQPTIDLCRSGIPVTEYLEYIYTSNKEQLYADLTLRESYINPTTNDTYKAGSKVKRLKFANTLEVIANEGGDALHNGSLTDQFVKDIQGLGGLITKEDMNNYKPEWQEPAQVKMPNGRTLYSSSLPGSGSILVYILNLIQLKFDFTKPDSLVNLQRIAETFKFAYGARTRLGDTKTKQMHDFQRSLESHEKAKDVVKKIMDDSTSQDPTYYGADVENVEDHGTAHICVLAPDGDAVSITSTINYYFGSAVSAPSTDIILNDEMDDFSSPDIISIFGMPPSKNNFIEPQKRPLSSMSPAIVTNGDRVELVIGAAGGTKITSTIALTIMKHLWFGMDIKDAIDDCRLHHQLFPMKLQAELCYNNSEFRNYMKEIGHDIMFSGPDGFSAVTSISNKDGIKAGYDKRRPGSTSYVNG